MISSVSLRRRAGKASSRKAEPPEDGLLGFDLLHHLTFLSVIAAAGIPRGTLFAHAAHLPISTAVYFQEVEHLVRNLNYDYGEAFRIVGEKSKREAVKGLFLRLAGALSTGEPEAELLAREARLYADAYANRYESALETLRKWTDAYAALVVSAVLIVIVALISTIIYDVGTTLILGLVGLMAALCGLGVWVIFRSAPREARFIPPPQGLPSQRLPRRVALSVTPAALLAAVAAGLLGAPLGWTLVLLALAFLPVGVLASRFDARVHRMAQEIATLLRVGGATATAIGTTVSEAIGRIDLRTMPTLAPAIRRLHLRLLAGADPPLAWERLVTETGSELVRRSVHMFLEGVALGGEPEEVGSRASLLAMKAHVLREKRKLVTRTFGWLTMALHTAVVFLLTFAVTIVGAFGDLIQQITIPQMTGDLPLDLSSFMTLSFAHMDTLEGLLGPLVVVLAGANALAPHLAEGGYPLRLFFYGAFTLAASGGSLLLSPMLVERIVGAIAAFP
jgi:flagellar protein FlaJ